MKKLILCIVLFFTVYASIAQNEKVIGEITYSFSHIMDTNQIGKVYHEDMTLRFNKVSSEYFSKTAALQKQMMEKKFEEASKSGSNQVDLGKTKKVNMDQVFIFKKKNNFVTLKSFRNVSYLIEEKTPVINWEIKKDTKEINGYVCQKAIGAWKGHIYTAWFTTDLPYSFGPWKLQGLPGLILQAQDERNFISFLLNDIVFLTENKSIQLPEDVVKTSEKDFKKMVNAFKSGTVSSSNSSNDIKIEVTSSSGQAAKNIKRPTINNPLEKD